MTIVQRGTRYSVRWAASEADLVACQSLRHQCFFGCEGRDADALDGRCDHAMIMDGARLVATFRLAAVGALDQTYAAQSYDVTPLAAYTRPMLELGRFCIAPGATDGDVLRLAWGAVAQRVDVGCIGMIFGCSSFAGTDPAPYWDALGLLGQRYLGPSGVRPGRRANETLALPSAPQDRKQAVSQLPPLLRSYLGMGGWVSDHLVVDPVLNTLHVFTALEIDRIPPARAAALRGIARALKGTCAQTRGDIADGHGTYTPSSAL